MTRPYRAWYNQPSTLQPLHHLHGKVCIAYDGNGDGDDYTTAYFTDGDIHSMRVPRAALVRVKLSSAKD